MEPFITAAEADDTDEIVGKPITFMLDDEEVTALPPTTSQMALFMAAFADSAPNDEVAVMDTINFFMSLFEGDDATYVKRKLLDRNDPFGLKAVTKLIILLVEEWSGRPMSSPQDSPTLPASDGPRLTATTRSKAGARVRSA